MKAQFSQFSPPGEEDLLLVDIEHGFDVKITAREGPPNAWNRRSNVNWENLNSSFCSVTVLVLQKLGSID